jgi:predicted DNA binding CopG/RHH family protein
MKKLIVNPENPNGLSVDLTAEEIEQMNTDIANEQARLQAITDAEAQKEIERQAKEDLKASAKAKLIAGEALTEEEANVMIGG